MYSQYNYYQNNNSNSQQQPQQPQQATSTANQVWNGQQWVSTTNNVANQQQQSYSQSATGSTQQVANGQGIVGQGGGGQSMVIKHGKTHAELVQHYTSCKFYVCYFESLCIYYYVHQIENSLFICSPYTPIPLISHLFQFVHTINIQTIIIGINNHK